MFTRIGRRLALLNALVVIAVIGLTGLVTYAALSRSLDREVDAALRDRIRTALAGPELAAPGTPTPVRSDDEDEEAHDDEAEHERDTAVVESGDTLLFVVDASGRVLVNPRGVTLAEVPVAAGLERALAGHEDARTVDISGAGRVRALSLPVREDGRVIGAVQALRSLREHDRELALLRWMTLAGVAAGAVVAVPAGLYLARQAMRPIAAAFERERMFVADASHELRTPLTLIRANAEYALLDEEKRVADVRPELAAIIAEVDRTEELVSGLLVLARADAGRLPLDRQPHDLTQVVREAAEALRPLFDRKGVALETVAGEPVLARVDAGRLTQVLRILLDNARAHTPPGGTVRIRVMRERQAASVVVEDNGSGITPADLPHIFDRFYRADASRARATGGAGLGLPIAKALVDAHGGSIRIESAPGQGTRVTVTLPLDSQEAC